VQSVAVLGIRTLQSPGFGYPAGVISEVSGRAYWRRALAGGKDSVMWEATWGMCRPINPCGSSDSSLRRPTLQRLRAVVIDCLLDVATVASRYLAWSAWHRACATNGLHPLSLPCWRRYLSVIGQRASMGIYEIYTGLRSPPRTVARKRNSVRPKGPAG
jgi:hypothetical protein